MFRRGAWGIGALLALSMTATSAQAFQVGIFNSLAHDGRIQARFIAAPWDRTDVTARASDGGQTVTFHDANGIAGKNPPPNAPGPWWISPCTIVDQHTARCHSAGILEVYVSLSDAPSRFRDLAPAAGTSDPYEWVFSGMGNDDIAIAHGWFPYIQDAGGANTLKISSANGEVDAYNGVDNVIDVRNGTAGDYVNCRLGFAPQGTVATDVDDHLAGATLADHGESDNVLGDPGDVIDGCENDLPV